jgi:hypothetical protein
MATSSSAVTSARKCTRPRSSSFRSPHWNSDKLVTLIRSKPLPWVEGLEGTKPHDKLSRRLTRKPKVRVKGRTHLEIIKSSETLTSSPRDADAGRQRKEGVYVQIAIARTSLDRISPKTRKRPIARTSLHESKGEACLSSTRCREGSRIHELAGIES